MTRRKGRCNDIVHILRFIHRQKFKDVSKAMQIRFDCVNTFKRAGFIVGIESDSYFVAAPRT